MLKYHIKENIIQYGTLITWNLYLVVDQCYLRFMYVIFNIYLLQH